MSGLDRVVDDDRWKQEQRGRAAAVEDGWGTHSGKSAMLRWLKRLAKGMGLGPDNQRNDDWHMLFSRLVDGLPQNVALSKGKFARENDNDQRTKVIGIRFRLTWYERSASKQRKMAPWPKKDQAVRRGRWSRVEINVTFRPHPEKGYWILEDDMRVKLPAKYTGPQDVSGAWNKVAQSG